MTVITEQYLESLRSREAELACLPFEHVARNRSFSDFLARLVAERNALAARSSEVSRTPRFIVVARANQDVIEQAIFSASLQSHPAVAVLLLEVRPDRQQAGAILATAAECPDGLQVEICADQAPLPLWVDDGDYLIPFDHGDILHPALACTLALLSLLPDGSPPDVWSWNATCYRVSGDHGFAVATGFVRKPAGPDLSWLSGDVVGRAFAVRAGKFRTLFHEGVGALSAEGLDTRTLRLAMAGVSWRHHAEYFGLYRATGPDALLRPRAMPENEIEGIRRFAALYLPRLETKECPRGTSARGERRPSIQPATLGDGISVIISFRDNAELTLKTVAAVASQVVGTWMELILVDNQSRPAELERLRGGLRSLGGDDFRVEIVGYPHPFSHSRQCNLGARVATGETLVFLSNDATLETPTVLDALARWAGVLGVSTVGARIVRPSGELQCAGLKARQNAGFDYNSPLEESRDPLFSTGLREVAGNSFACAAIRRSRFFDHGGLDEVLFPIGHNDVDFCLRAAELGFRHLLVGWVHVAHTPGGSRGSSDEMLQKVLLRDRYPQTPRLSQYQLETDPQILKMSVAKSQSQLASSKPLVFLEKLWGRVLEVTSDRAAGALHKGKQ